MNESFYVTGMAPFIFLYLAEFDTLPTGAEALKTPHPDCRKAHLALNKERNERDWFCLAESFLDLIAGLKTRLLKPPGSRRAH